MNAGGISEKNPGIKATLPSLWPNMRYMGYGILLAWVYLLLDYGIWRSGTDENSSNTAFFGMYFFGVSAILLAVTATIAIKKPRLVEQFLDSRIASCLILFFSVVGSLSLIFVGPLILPNVIPSTMRDACFFIGSALCSIVTTLEMVQCARRYCCLDPNRMLLCALLSELTVFILFAIVSAYDDLRIIENGPPISGVIALCILPSIAWLCLRLPDKTLKAPTATADETRPEIITMRETVQTELDTITANWRLFLAIFVFTTTASIVGNSFAGTQLTNDYQWDAKITMLLRVALALVFIMGSFTVIRRTSLARFYLLASTGIALALALVSLFGIESNALKIVSNALFFALILVVWCLLVFVTQAGRYPVVPLFSIGLGCLCSGMFIGYLLNASSDIALLLTTNKIFSSALVIAVLLCAIVVFNEKGLDEYLHNANADDINLHQVARNAALANQPPTRKSGLWEQACLKTGERYKLSKREQEILRQLADNRTPQDMASYLCISLSTVRTHTRNIYAKLDVHSRDELIALVRSEYENLL